MEDIFLEALPRQEIGRGKTKKIRDEGFILAVVYAEGKESLAIKLSHKEVWGVIHQHRLENAVINLKIKDDKKQKARPCLIKEIQYDPVQGDIIHIDFNEVSLTKAIKVNVPVVAKGEPAGVKQEGGSLEHILWEVEVECLPTDIPKEIEVDVSNLKIGDSIRVKDMIFPSNIKIITPIESIVLSVAAPIKVEEVVVPLAEGEETQEPEVIKEKKEVPAEGEAAVEEKEKEKGKK